MNIKVGCRYSLDKSERGVRFSSGEGLEGFDPLNSEYEIWETIFILFFIFFISKIVVKPSKPSPDQKYGNRILIKILVMTA